MRLSKPAALLDLARSLAASAGGLSIEEIGAALGAGRRTAERYRAALAEVFDLEERREGARKRWRLRAQGVDLRLLGRVAPEELAELAAAEQALRSRGLDARAGLLRRLGDRVKASLGAGALLRLEPDLAALLEAEGLAMRPGPRPRVPAGLLTSLRQAILACLEVRFSYTTREGVRRRHAGMRPHGILFGDEDYMVAFHARGPDPVLFRLAAIRGLKMTEQGFARDPRFDLRAFAARSFGVFQEPPLDVVVRFEAAAAKRVREHFFHPTQTIEKGPQGSAIVRFRAGGRVEMCRHLFAWGEAVEIVEPLDLRQQLAQLCRQAARHHRRSPSRAS